MRDELWLAGDVYQITGNHSNTRSHSRPRDSRIRAIDHATPLLSLFGGTSIHSCPAA